jgi:hypothetical protein
MLRPNLVHVVRGQNSLLGSMLNVTSLVSNDELSQISAVTEPEMFVGRCDHAAPTGRNAVLASCRRRDSEVGQVRLPD